MKFKILSFLKMSLCYLMIFLIIKLGMCGIGMHVYMCCFHVGFNACGGHRLVLDVFLYYFNLVFETDSFREPRATN